MKLKLNMTLVASWFQILGAEWFYASLKVIPDKKKTGDNESWCGVGEKKKGCVKVAATNCQVLSGVRGSQM